MTAQVRKFRRREQGTYIFTAALVMFIGGATMAAASIYIAAVGLQILIAPISYWIKK